MTYDPVGNMSSLTNANGEIISYEYDKLNRLSKKILPDETFTMSYNPIGKIGLVTDSRGTTTYTYDARQRLIEQKEPDGNFLRYGYDAASNRTLLATPTGTTTFTYDKYNQLATVNDPTGNITTYTYDKAGNLTQTIMPNSVLETRNYDTLNRLTQIQSQKDGTVLFSAAYTLDNAGMRTQVVETGRTVNYTYNNLYRLLSEDDGVSSTSYSYDPTGNRVTKTNGSGTATYVYDANDRLLSDGTTTYAYDANGNKLTETKAGVTTTYTWDAESRLKGSQSGNTNTVYDYDFGGIRVSQTVNGTETKYLVDKNRNYAQVLEEYAPNGTVNATYIYGNDLISQSRNAIDSFYGYDGLGSTRVLTDDLGVVTDSYTYDAYGTLSASTGTTENSYLYAGEQFDKGLNQYYLRDRYYGTDIGRFTQRDRFEGDMMTPMSRHRFMYGNVNPVTFSDPSGMSAIAAEQLTILSIISTLAKAQVYTIGLAGTQILAARLLGRDLKWKGDLTLGSGKLTYPPFTGTLAFGALTATSGLAQFSPFGGLIGKYVGSWVLVLGSINLELPPSILQSSFGIKEVTLTSPSILGANPLTLAGGALFFNIKNYETQFSIGFGVGKYSQSPTIDTGISLLSGVSIPLLGVFILFPVLPE